MPYFVHLSSRTVAVTPPGSRMGLAYAEVDAALASRLGLTHGMQLSKQSADMLLAGTAEDADIALTDDERAAIARVQESRTVAVSSPQAVSLDNCGLLLSTTPYLPGYEITELIGVVGGNTVRTRNALSRLGAGLSATFGGELGAYTRLLTDSRNEAMDRMVHDARRMGANAIVGIVFNTSELLEIATELLVVGTAVKAVRITAPGQP
jgi:uncharacterized protein YbjQ (UPF0145 family)